MTNKSFYIFGISIFILEILMIIYFVSDNNKNCIKACGQYQVTHCDIGKAICVINSTQIKTIYLKK